MIKHLFEIVNYLRAAARNINMETLYAYGRGKERAEEEWKKVEGLLEKHPEYYIRISGDEVRLYAPFKTTTSVGPWKDHKDAGGAGHPEPPRARHVDYSFVPVCDLTANYLEQAIGALDSRLEKQGYTDVLKELTTKMLCCIID